jgi:hypothetical protein
MNGPTAITTGILLSSAGATPAAAWSVVATVGVGAGSGRPGIVVREGATGRTLLWSMDGVTTAATTPLFGDLRWSILRRPGRAVG